MPFKWTPEECQKLVWHVLAKCDFKPNPEVFASAAETLGGGVNANACRLFNIVAIVTPLHHFLPSVYIAHRNMLIANLFSTAKSSTS